LDRSNIEDDKAVGWPIDPIASINKLKSSLLDKLRGENGWSNEDTIGIIITDSCLRPRRLGLVAQALVVSGFNPIVSQIGRPDLCGHPLTVTYEAVADQLATAANFLMRNADQAISAVIVRDHGLASSEFEGWVPGIDVDDDLFRGVI
ncbi:MAG: coenzyme F420-0:L-glutamate ligase, partial [Candidatus Peribacteraceae bacterium]|nr:coenzyme F420-0:L-glutamate ligase [Candidatus Peribacteraceae bacterium]